MVETIERFLKDERGQSMTEYILITVLVAIALIGAWKLFGHKLFDLIKGSANEIQKINPEGVGDKKSYPFK